MDQRVIDPAAIKAEVDRVRSLGLDDLRRRWRMTFGAVPPPGLTKDIMSRMIAYRIQEEAFGGLDRGLVSVTRVPAHEVETAVLAAARDHLNNSIIGETLSSWSDRELVDRCIERITIKDGLIEIRLLKTSKPKSDKTPATGRDSKSARNRKALSDISVPWTATPLPRTRASFIRHRTSRP